MKGNKKKKNKNEDKNNKSSHEEKDNNKNKSDSGLPKSIQQKYDKIVLIIHAKPGSKKEGICSIDDECIEVAVHAKHKITKLILQ